MHGAAPAVPGIEEVDLEFVGDDRGGAPRPAAHLRPACSATAAGDDARADEHAGHEPPDRRTRTAAPVPAFLAPDATTRVIGVSSGKGGVGKSTVTVNLAIALAQAGHRVGLLDADVYGFSVPKMLGTDHDPVILGDIVLPTSAHGVRCLSMGYFVPDDQPVIWRGPMLHKAIQQFLTDAYWGEPDFVLVDMPPGTGDVALTLAEVMPRAEIVVVTTPQPAAQRVAQRSAFAARRLKLSVRGVIENMSWFTGDDGTRYELFGSGGGATLAADLGVPLLGQVPLVNAVRLGGDEGRPVTAVDPDAETAGAFRAITEKLVALGPARVYRREAQLALRRARGGPSPHLRFAVSRARARKSTTWSRPERLASYMALSASRRSVAGVAEPSAVVTTPMLAVTTTWASPMATGALSPLRMRSAMSNASSSWSTSAKATNSSPPKRATTSTPRVIAMSRLAISFRTRSPAEWSARSLTSLKRSRSMNMTASACRRRPTWRSASCSFSMNRVRLAKPVSPSCEAWNAICSAISQRSIARPTIPASWSNLCSSSLPKYGMEALISTASAWRGAARASAR